MERKLASSLVALFVGLFSLCGSFAQTNKELNNWLTVLDDTCIFNNNSHAAFTALEKYNGSLFLAFREGDAHHPTLTNNGVIRVLQQNTGKWLPKTTFAMEGYDLRDPYLIKMNDSLFLYTCENYSKYAENGWTDLKHIIHDAPFEPSIWKKRLYNNTMYGIGNRRGCWPLLMKSNDGIHWQVVCEYKLGGDASEADLVFISNTMYICFRVDNPEGSYSIWGQSVYPFNETKWSIMDISIASPEMIALSKNTILLACREFEFHRKDGKDSIYVSIFALDKEGRVKERFIVDSNSVDQGYPSFVKINKSEFLMSYYTGSHKTHIRMLHFKVNNRKIRRVK